MHSGWIGGNFGWKFGETVFWFPWNFGNFEIFGESLEFWGLNFLTLGDFGAIFDQDFVAKSGLFVLNSIVESNKLSKAGFRAKIRPLFAELWLFSRQYFWKI